MNVLVTGSSTGIGLSTALHFARLGHRVFASARAPEASAGLQQGLAEGLPLHTVRLDVDQDDSVAAAVAEVICQAGHIDVLVNNAGIGGAGPVELSSIGRAKRTFETNYFGAVRMIRAVLPGMRERRSGAVINVTSIAGRVALAGHSHYAASKFALEGLSEILAQEVRPFGIRVAIIEPGVVRTPIFSKGNVKTADMAPYEMPFRRLWKYFEKALQNATLPEAVAAAIEHAVSTDQPKLRYLVGADAQTVMAGRHRLTDEEWIAAQATEDDEAFYREMKSIYGEDLYAR